MPLPDAVCWPPKTFEHAAHLEQWMTVTAYQAVTTLVNSDALKGGEKLLDVGGGDGRKFFNDYIYYYKSGVDILL
jgi:hypothetical protein